MILLARPGLFALAPVTRAVRRAAVPPAAARRLCVRARVDSRHLLVAKHRQHRPCGELQVEVATPTKEGRASPPEPASREAGDRWCRRGTGGSACRAAVAPGAGRVCDASGAALQPPPLCLPRARRSAPHRGAHRRRRAVWRCCSVCHRGQGRCVRGGSWKEVRVGSWEEVRCLWDREFAGTRETRCARNIFDYCLAPSMQK